MESVSHLLSSATGNRDEQNNINLAVSIVRHMNTVAINELINNLSNATQRIRHDSIKVLYEVGDRKPELIRPHLTVFLNQLQTGSNRVQWGAMTALNAIAKVDPDAIHSQLHRILAAYESGSVITKDNAFRIVLHLYSIRKYSSNLIEIVRECLLKSPINQFPMYCELTLGVILPKHSHVLANTIRSRIGECPKESLKNRLNRVLKKCH